MATEDQSVQTAPIGRISDAGAPPQTAIPTLNPTDSPYKPLNLPTVEPKQIPLADQQPVQNLGATSKGGGLAYIADQILRGVVKGYDAGQQQKADQYNKKLQAQDQVYNAQAAEVHDIAAAGRAGTFTGPPGPDGKPTFVMSDEFKQARNRAFIAWQAMYQTVGERIPQPKKSAKSKQGQNQPQPTDQTTLVQAVANHQNDPQGATQAIYAAAGKLGPPVFHQIAGFLTPEYVAKQQTAAKTETSQATAAATTADTGATVADINNKLAHAVQSGAPQDEIDKLIKQRDELSPSAKFPIAGVQRSGQVDGKWYEWRVDENGKEIPDTRRPLSTAGLGAKAPKIGWTKIDGKWGSQLYDPETNQPVPNTFDSTKVPPSNVLALYPSEHTLTGKFVDSNGVLQTYSTTSTSQREVPGGVGESGGTPAAESATPAAPKPTKKAPASPPASSGSSTHPVGYVGSPEYKQLIKQATDAQKDFNSASTNLSTMLKTAKEAKQGDGAAQVGIISAYLKTVVGGQGTGVRITKPEWDAAVKTRPFLEGIKASFSPDGYLTGAVISPQQVDQMVNEVHQKTKSLFENVDAAKKRAQDQKTADMSAGGLSGNSTPSAPQSNSIDDEILNLVKH